MKKLNREEAVALVGEAAVNKVESTNCEHCSTQDNGLQWWTATVSVDSEDYGTLTAVYAMDSDKLEGVEDLSYLDWVIDYYEAN